MPGTIPFPKPARQGRRRILNALSIRSLQAPSGGRVDYFDDATPGLTLRITANDIRTWTVFYHDKHARQKRLTLGWYPAVTLADARELAREALLKVARGGDPVHLRPIQLRCREAPRDAVLGPTADGRPCKQIVNAGWLLCDLNTGPIRL